MNLRGVILDVDGTLVDSNDAHAKAWEEAFRRGGLEIPFERIRPLIGMGGDNLVPELTGFEKDDPQRHELSESWKEIFQEKYLPQIRAFPGVRKLLQRMKDQGLRRVVGTSAKKELMDSLLQIAGVKDLIEAATSADDAENSKPEPDLVQAALEKLGLRPEETVMLGDTPYDIEAARKAGVGTIALRCGGFSDEALAGALEVYDDPQDLLRNFDRSVFGQGHAIGLETLSGDAPGP